MTTTAERPALTEAEARTLDSYWRAANYLSAGQIYLLDNPLLTEPLRPEHIKPRLLGHWGTTPGLNFIWAHLDRLITNRDLDMMFVIGPGHGGPAALANTWLEGSYSQIYPGVPRDGDGMRALFRQFSFPGGVPSHVAPQTPGSIHEGGELGYSLAHAHGAAFDNPGLIVACAVGDGEAETGPLAASWHSHRFLDPARDGAVLPILHLNGWKIANPAVLARIPQDELDALLRGYGYDPIYVTGHEPVAMHRDMAAALDRAINAINVIQREARSEDQTAVITPRLSPGRSADRSARWPMIVLRSPKGWTGPAQVDGRPVEGTWRAHQVPLAEVRTNPEHLRQLEEWLWSYRPRELFDTDGRPQDGLLRLVPHGDRRLGANPHANGGLLLRDLAMPDFRDYAVPVPEPGARTSESTRVLGGLLRDVMARNAENFRVVGPDETASNRLDALYEVTGKTWEERVIDVDEHLAADGRVMEILSEHICQGWLEGYLLTGRHGLFSCYEAFIHIVDSMFNQHAKWLETSRRLPWRRPVASLNYLLTSHVWQQEHNGFSHQDPGFIDVAMNKKPEVIRVYLPPDTNTLLTPLEGLVMATRCGNLDPGLLMWLLQHGGLSPDEVSRGIEHAAGLAGLAALPDRSGDMREVRAAADAGSPAARLAIDVHAHRLRQEVASMAAAMDGLDALIFTGGIGEHQPLVRAETAAGLGFLGVAIDPARNDETVGGDAEISAVSAQVRTLVITAREDVEIARQVRAALPSH